MAKVRPGSWMLTKNVRPLGAKHAPANSLSPPALRAKANGCSVVAQPDHV